MHDLRLQIIPSLDNMTLSPFQVVLPYSMVDIALAPMEQEFALREVALRRELEELRDDLRKLQRLSRVRRWWLKGTITSLTVSRKWGLV